MSGKLLETSDLCLATTLSVRGCKIIDTRRLDNSKVIFAFERNKESEGVRQYYESQLSRVEPTRFIAEYRRLKTLAMNMEGPS